MGAGLFGQDNSNEGIVIGTTPIIYPDNTSGQMTINGKGDQRIAQSLPELTEILRFGKSYGVRTSAGIAALVAIPTTTAAFSIYNGEAPGVGAASYAIDSIFTVEIVTDATQQDYTSIWVMMNPQSSAFTPVIDTLASSARNLSGKAGAYAGAARIGVSATVVDNGWLPIGNPSAFATAFAGALWRVTDIPIKGLYHVRPGAQFNIHATKVAAAALQLHFGVRWHEVIVTNG